MQLIWVPGPASQLVKLSITRRSVVLWLCGLALGLVLLGALGHWIGLRVALEYMPEFALRLGGVTSQSQQAKVEEQYRTQLQALNQQLVSVSERLNQIESTKKEVFGRMDLDKRLSSAKRGPADQVSGQGGPALPMPGWGLVGPALDQQIEWSLAQAKHYENTSMRLQSHWEQGLKHLDRIPSHWPIGGDFLLTSSFGVRVDPLSRMPSMHEGLDFVAPVGTPVLATAAGEVVKAEFSGAFGHLVELTHADGFSTRYAHLNSILVKPGERVALHGVVGTLGNTGRSTGPHLHYEVLHKGRAIPPTKALAAWAHN